MWILPAPSTSCQSAPAWAGSISASSSELPLPLAELLASSAALKGKPTAAKSWRLAWKRNAWLRTLSGRICEPSISSRGVESWIGWLAATRASRSLLQASEKGNSTTGTSGPASATVLKLSEGQKNSRVVSSRTFEDTSRADSTMWSETFKTWVSELQRDYTRRRKLVQATAGSGSSSWPTEDWQTPTGSMMSSRKQVGATEREDLLPNQAATWTTPQAHDANPRGRGNRHNPKAGNACLGWDASLWPTARASEKYKYQYNRGGLVGGVGNLTHADGSVGTLADAKRGMRDGRTEDAERSAIGRADA